MDGEFNIQLDDVLVNFAGDQIFQIILGLNKTSSVEKLLFSSEKSNLSGSWNESGIKVVRLIVGEGGFFSIRAVWLTA